MYLTLILLMKKLLLLPFIILPYLAYNQCHPLRHSTDWFEGWYACSVKPNPNPARSASHWLLIDLGDPHRLQKSYWWNFNYPKKLDSGVKVMEIDYSVDGETWKFLKSVNLPKATGEIDYEGFEGPDLDDVEARYVLLTVIQTYGESCAGLSEVSIEGIKSETTTSTKRFNPSVCLQAKIAPNPVFGNATIDLAGLCEGQVYWNVTDIMGRKLMETGIGLTLPLKFDLDFSRLPAGVYQINFFNNNTSLHEKIIKVN